MDGDSVVRVGFVACRVGDSVAVNSLPWGRCQFD